MNKITKLALGALMLFAVVGCNEADTVSRNISQEADRFNVPRRIALINGITDKYLLTIEGYCSIGNDRTEFEISFTCKTGPGDQYKKHFLGLSDNVTYIVEQLDASNINPDHYKIVFRPSELVPDIDVN